MTESTSFAPIIDDKSKVLILGTMPGGKSLEERQYYANPRNQFWKIIDNLFDETLPTDYEEKIEFLKNNGIALWDVLKACYREGSLDSNIKNEEVNDFTTLFDNYPNIRCVGFNGTKAYNIFKKSIGFDFQQLDFVKLPSTSPAHTIKFEQKLKEWEKIRKYLT
ncbi:DNA-deoxyinosine glycosylase [Natranaerofaba carboxydovora]|uniref:DNA-deoxyinosine glycosylase n=1 Tax=Natranaerofaba carboxydovora TaxID=2742683 RepID=UPI001F13A4B7|nr:DNA-deoxyinosine glycosylase [Natranaerofaba carboxydovora]UMZ72970.1 Uracil DNA glycosylase superfamily protein [Natranaerofaba carboxydovora]